MLQVLHPSKQTDSKKPPRETMPTMYDLPSEDAENPGKARRVSHLATPTPWHKRPDWFIVAGVPRLYDHKELRLSYVMWQEGVRPLVVVELLSPSTYSVRGRVSIVLFWDKSKLLRKRSLTKMKGW